MNGRKVTEERWKFLRKTWGPANLSQVGEQVWYEQMDMREGGRRGGLLFPPETFDRVSVCCLSHCSRMFIFLQRRDEILFQAKKKKKIGFQFVNYNYCDRWLMIKTIDHILFWENIDFRIFSSEEIIYFKKYQFMYESNHVVFMHILRFLSCFICKNKRIFFLFFEVLIIIANF